MPEQAQDLGRGFLCRRLVYAVQLEEVDLEEVVKPHSPTLGGMLSRRACSVLLPSSSPSVMLASSEEMPNSLSFTIPIRLPLVLRGVSPVRDKNIEIVTSIYTHVYKYWWNHLTVVTDC